MTEAFTKPAAILWDMDGTLVDTEEYWIAAEIQIATQAGGTWSHADGLSVVGKPIPVTAAELQTRAGVQLPIPEIVQSLIQMVESQMRTKGIPWRPGALELLMQVKSAGIRSALVTMSYKQLADAVLEQLPDGSIEVVVTGDIVKQGKPHPEPYETAIKLLGVCAGDCVAIEDSLTGVLSAEAAGAKVLGVPHMVPIPAAPNRNRANSLQEIGMRELAKILSDEVLDLIAD